MPTKMPSVFVSDPRPRRLMAIAASILLVSLLTGSALAEELKDSPAAATPQATEPAAATETPAATPQATDPATPAAEPAAGDAPVAAPTSGPPMPITYLGKQYPEPLPLSYAEKPITDKGIQGARLSIKEANQAGNFVGHSFDLKEVILPDDGDVVAKAKEILKNGPTFIIADLQTADLLAVADLPEAKDSVIMNIRSSATALRQELCRVNVFHIIPDYAMRADALAQYMIWKKWPRWFVLRRDTLADRDYLAQVKRAAARFGGKVVEDRIYALPPGARNLDSGHP